MNSRDERDDLLRALAMLPEADLEPERARDLLEQAMRAFSRRHRLRAAVARAERFYTHLFEPVAAGLLSVGVLASAAAQAVQLLSLGIGLWRGVGR